MFLKLFGGCVNIGVTGKMKAGTPSVSGDFTMRDFNEVVERLSNPSKDFCVAGVSMTKPPGYSFRTDEQGICAGDVVVNTLMEYPRVAPILRMIEPVFGAVVYPDLEGTNGWSMYRQAQATPFHLDGYYATPAGKRFAVSTCHIDASCRSHLFYSSA